MSPSSDSQLTVTTVCLALFCLTPTCLPLQTHKSRLPATLSSLVFVPCFCVVCLVVYLFVDRSFLPVFSDSSLAQQENTILLNAFCANGFHARSFSIVVAVNIRVTRIIRNPKLSARFDFSTEKDVRHFAFLIDRREPVTLRLLCFPHVHLRVVARVSRYSWFC